MRLGLWGRAPRVSGHLVALGADLLLQRFLLQRAPRESDLLQTGLELGLLCARLLQAGLETFRSLADALEAGRVADQALILLDQSGRVNHELHRAGTCARRSECREARLQAQRTREEKCQQWHPQPPHHPTVPFVPLAA
eukprot:scaffold119678_cov57-Phaeocystis_antarctica.AAC.6